MQVGRYYRSRKTGGLYFADFIVEDQTNGREGTPMVVYWQESTNKRFVRTVEEFEKKFDQL